MELNDVRRQEVLNVDPTFSTESSTTTPARCASPTSTSTPTSTTYSTASIRNKNQMNTNLKPNSREFQDTDSD